MPLSISSAMFRLALAIERLLNLLQNRPRDTLGLVLRVKGQHPDLAVRSMDVVDDADPAALAPTANTPSQLTDTARPANYSTGFRVLGNRLLQCGVLVVGQIAVHQTREELRLDECKCRRHYTSKT